MPRAVRSAAPPGACARLCSQAAKRRVRLTSPLFLRRCRPGGAWAPRRRLHASLSVRRAFVRCPHSEKHKGRRMASRRADPLRYTRRRSPDTLALVVAAVLACLLCQAGWSAAFGDGLPQLDVGPHRRLLNDFTPLQKVRRGPSLAAGSARGRRGACGRRAGARFREALQPVAQPSGRPLRAWRRARATRARAAREEPTRATAALERRRSARFPPPWPPFRSRVRALTAPPPCAAPVWRLLVLPRRAVHPAGHVHRLRGLLCRLARRAGP